MKKLRAIFHPDQFQGWGKTKRYFEGWYFKVLNQDESKAYAFIPGIAMDNNGVKQAFVQVLDGKKQIAEYHKFDVALFHSNENKFEIEIAGNFFSNNNIKLELPNLQGNLTFSNISPWPSSWYSPGIMGPFSFVPFMECYHGILSMDHRIDGNLHINGELIDFSNGRGYIEKDWGHSFPSAYLWMQTNHFSRPEISIKISVANIPWMGRSFVGFIAGVWLQDHLIKFTTYNGSKLVKSFVDNSKVEIVIENNNYRLDIQAQRHKTASLASPIAGFMDGRIDESLTSNIEVLLFDKKNNVILLNDIGRNAGLEVAGNIQQIMIN
jgi:hypothetical protein